MNVVQGFTDETTFTVRVHHEDGSLWAEVLNMPGCYASGETMDELAEALTEAIGMYLSSKNVTVEISGLRFVEPEAGASSTEDDGELRIAVPA